MGDMLGAQCQWTWLDNAAVRQSRQVVFLLLLLFFETEFNGVQSDLKLIKWPRMTLNSWSTFLYLLNSGFT